MKLSHLIATVLLALVLFVGAAIITTAILDGADTFPNFDSPLEN